MKVDRTEDEEEIEPENEPIKGDLSLRIADLAKILPESGYGLRTVQGAQDLPRYREHRPAWDDSFCRQDQADSEGGRAKMSHSSKKKARQARTAA